MAKKAARFLTRVNLDCYVHYAFCPPAELQQRRQATALFSITDRRSSIKS
jgi:hypothetical protein